MFKTLDQNQKLSILVVMITVLGLFQVYDVVLTQKFLHRRDRVPTNGFIQQGYPLPRVTMKILDKPPRKDDLSYKPNYYSNLAVSFNNVWDGLFSANLCKKSLKNYYLGETKSVQQKALQTLLDKCKLPRDEK